MLFLIRGLDMRKVASFFLFSLAILAPSGCGKAGFYPAKGQFVDASDAPVTVLEGFEVTFEGHGPDGKSYSSTGTIDDQGRFELFTDRPGDGAPMGEGKLLIQPKMKDSEREFPYPLNPKYRTFEKSGLTAKIEPKPNELKFTVELKAGKQSLKQ
jgi:hypothetical protein